MWEEGFVWYRFEFWSVNKKTTKIMSFELGDARRDFLHY